MLVCGIKKVYEYLEKYKVEKIYLTKDFNDKDTLDFIELINKDEEVIEVYYVDREELDDMTNKKVDEHEDIVAETKNMIPFILILIVATGLLLFITFGLSFSMFDSHHKHPHPGPGTDTEVGQIILNYSDVNGKGPGIYVENAMAISDAVGKKITGKGKYFDFTVSGSTSNIPLRYYILLDIKDNSTLGDKNVKVYLTKMKGTIEEEILDKTYKVNELKDMKFKGEENKIIYFKDLDKKDDEFVDNYRLRIWISDDAENYFNKKYSLTVNVYGEGR